MRYKYEYRNVSLWETIFGRKDRKDTMCLAPNAPRGDVKPLIEWLRRDLRQRPPTKS